MSATNKSFKCVYTFKREKDVQFFPEAVALNTRMGQKYQCALWCNSCSEEWNQSMENLIAIAFHGKLLRFLNVTTARLPFRACLWIRKYHCCRRKICLVSEICMPIVLIGFSSQIIALKQNCADCNSAFATYALDKKWIDPYIRFRWKTTAFS